jgi:predicted permease
MHQLWKDARYSLRMLGKAPGVTLAAVAALAVGIGANTAIFTLVKAALLSPLPYPQPERVALLMRNYDGNRVPTTSVLKFDYWRRNNRSFESLAAFDALGSGVNLVAPGAEPERVLGLRVAGEFFRTLGVQPAIGRGFSREEDRAGGPRAVVISYGLWQRRFGGQPGLIGQFITLSGVQHQVVGIMPREFRFVPLADLWYPLQGEIRPDDQSNYLLCVGRLRSGVTLAQARGDLEGVGQGLRRDYGAVMGDRESVAVVAAAELLAGFLRPALLILFAAVALVLLIACANVANLMLARAASRRKEMALRIAVGAGRFALARQLLVESLIVAAAGGLLGLLLGRFGISALLAFSPIQVPIFDFSPDLRVFAFTLVAAIGTALLFGLAPVIAAWRIDLNDVLKESSRGSTHSRQGGRVRRALVCGEMALAVVLVIAAGLLIQSLLLLRAEHAGFDPKNVLTLQMSIGGPRYEEPQQLDNYYRRALARVQSIPGVESAATVTSLPLERGPDFGISLEGREDAGGAQWRAITPDYFRVFRIPLVLGRFPAETDTAGSASVLVVNEAFVNRFLPKRNPIGVNVTVGSAPHKDGPRQIVGVVADVRETGLDSAPPAVMYLPAAQVPRAHATIINRLMPVNWVVRTHGEPLRMAENVRRELLSVDPLQPVSNIRSMEQVLSASLTVRDLSTWLLGIFAVIALSLAAIGVYGVMSYSVAQRSHEMGIRMALGARRGTVLAMVLRDAGVLSMIGALAGIAAAAALTRGLTTLLYGVAPTNVLIYSIAAVVLCIVALSASWVPAWRATRVDPMAALRHE